MVCKEGYFGPDCGIPCTPRDDSTGHFTCDEDGTIVCLPGYQNTATNCVEEVITLDPLTTDTQTDQDTTDTEPVTTMELITTRDPPSRTGQPANQFPILPVAVGAGVGVLVVIAIIIVAIIVVVFLCRPKQQNRRTNKEDEGVGKSDITDIML